MKKTYVKPEIDIYELPKQVLLAGSDRSTPNATYNEEGDEGQY